MTTSTQLYAQLIDLCATEAFYFQDFTLEDKTYRIFNYRLASYGDFTKAGALECRGVMFEVTPTGDFIRIASRPMHKFFNLNENPFTMGLDLSKVDTIELKADGSLMSSYTHNGRLCLKSRGSLFSEQAIDAQKWIHSQPDCAALVLQQENVGNTVNFEWCAPHNRIVIGYDQPHLKVLNARNRETGEYVSREELQRIFGHHAIDRVSTGGMDVASFIAAVPQLEDNIEGFVARIGDLWFKVKTNKYVSLHHAKDSINNPRRLFEAVVDEGIDDLRSMFVGDQVAIKAIDQMQQTVNHMYNRMVHSVEGFYEANKHLDRKEYAIKGRDPANLDQFYFGLAMSKYLGRPVEYKEFLKSKYKELGFKDEKVEANE